LNERVGEVATRTSHPVAVRAGQDVIGATTG
jgi:hypothetical protein